MVIIIAVGMAKTNEIFSHHERKKFGVAFFVSLNALTQENFGCGVRTCTQGCEHKVFLKAYRKKQTMVQSLQRVGSWIPNQHAKYHHHSLIFVFFYNFHFVSIVVIIKYQATSLTMVDLHSKWSGGNLREISEMHECSVTGHQTALPKAYFSSLGIKKTSFLVYEGRLPETKIKATNQAPNPRNNLCDPTWKWAIKDAQEHSEGANFRKTYNNVLESQRVDRTKSLQINGECSHCSTLTSKYLTPFFQGKHLQSRKLIYFQNKKVIESPRSTKLHGEKSSYPGKP